MDTGRALSAASPGHKLRLKGKLSALHPRIIKVRTNMLAQNRLHWELVDN
jgi:hypothetical protein